MPRITPERMSAVLGAEPKPGPIWQKQFDGMDETLRKIAQCDWQDIQAADLWEYTLDMAYQDLQPDLFRHVFPACLKFWYDTLMADESAEVGDSDLHRSLIRGNILARMLNEAERQRLLGFFVEGMLDRMDLERGFEGGAGSASAWISRFNSLGLVAPVIPALWTNWWSMKTPGSAICAVQYASGLIYCRGENPLYPARTPMDGGGGPDMTEWDAQVFDSVWCDSNLAFLRSILSPGYVIERMAFAATVLSGAPEAGIAERLARDARDRDDILYIRVEDMLENLAQLKLEQDHWD